MAASRLREGEATRLVRSELAQQRRDKDSLLIAEIQEKAGAESKELLDYFVDSSATLEKENAHLKVRIDELEREVKALQESFAFVANSQLARDQGDDYVAGETQFDSVRSVVEYCRVSLPNLVFLERVLDAASHSPIQGARQGVRCAEGS